MSDHITARINLENYWGEELKRIYIRHLGVRGKSISYLNVKNGEVIENALYGDYMLGDGSPVDYWFMEIETLNGEKYATKDNFSCSIKKSDNGNVTLGINGEAKTMYVHFPSSSDCSTALNKLK